MKTLSVLLLILSSVAMGASQEVAKFKKKSDGSNAKLIAQTDGRGDVVKMTFKVYDAKGKLDRNIVVSPAKARSGATLLSMMGVKILRITCAGFDTQNGGKCNLRYLKKYHLTKKNEYGTTSMNVERQGEKWTVLKNGRKVKQIIFHDHSSGIHRLQFVH